MGVFGDQKVVSMPTGMQVKRPSLGNEGPVFDHDDPKPLQRHLDVAGEKLWGAVQDRRIQFWCDSPEQLKLTSDIHFVSGVNAVMGSAYVSTHPSAGMPGWLGYRGPFINHNQTWTTAAARTVLVPDERDSLGEAIHAALEPDLKLAAADRDVIFVHRRLQNEDFSIVANLGPEEKTLRVELRVSVLGRGPARVAGCA